MTDNDRIVCLIPAKGTSKRLPGKNLINFLGKPLIVHSIISAQRSHFIKDIFVTTDDDAIEEISVKYGAKVVRRPAELSTDYSTTASALKHALQSDPISSLCPFAVLTLQPTNPLRPDDLIDTAVQLFIKERHYAHSLISISLNRHKIGKLENNRFMPLTYVKGQRSQDLEPYYYENGLLYLTKSEIIIEREDVFGDNVLTTIVNAPYDDIDIDEEIDLEWAEFIGKKYYKQIS